MLSQVIYLSRKEAEGLLTPTRNAAIISINDDREYLATLYQSWTKVCQIVFIDGVYTENDIELVGRNFQYVYNSFFREHHAMMIKSFLKEIELDCTVLYVHCHAGESRSGAVAKFVSEIYDIPAFRFKNGAFIQDNDFAKANRMIYKLLNKPDLFADLILEDKCVTKLKDQAHEKNRFLLIARKILRFF